MLKISRGKASDDRILLRLEGTLGGAWVTELREVCDEQLHHDRRIALDLGAVTYVDRAGTELLLALRDHPRVAVTSASAFVTELLKGGAA